jgi:hypothetical protein
MMRRRLVVLGQNILAPIALEFAPHAVDVVGVVVRVVEFDQEVGALDAVAMALVFLAAARAGLISHFHAALGSARGSRVSGS